MRNKEQTIARRNRIMIENIELSGQLIVFEGNDGCGKSTAIKYLSKFLKGQGIKNQILKFNMSSTTITSIKLGKKRFFGPNTNTLLHVASIIDQMERYILFELKKGTTIICDRYIYSIIARGIVRGVNRNQILNLIEWLPKPNITFYIDLDPKIALKRIGLENVSFWEAGRDIIYNKSYDESFLQFQSNVRDVFFEYASIWDFIILDGNTSQTELLKIIVMNLQEIISEVKK